ncbi:MAG TPA: hypothetical protein PKN33_10670 [Phycisphaerae bacterium]|nr:hypothetical protein [Phycisphaerae bacterium]
MTTIAITRIANLQKLVWRLLQQHRFKNTNVLSTFGVPARPFPDLPIIAPASDVKVIGCVSFWPA